MPLGRLEAEEELQGAVQEAEEGQEADGYEQDLDAGLGHGGRDLRRVVVQLGHAVVIEAADAEESVADARAEPAGAEAPDAAGEQAGEGDDEQGHAEDLANQAAEFAQGGGLADGADGVLNFLGAVFHAALDAVHGAVLAPLLPALPDRPGGRHADPENGVQRRGGHRDAPAVAVAPESEHEHEREDDEEDAEQGDVRLEIGRQPAAHARDHLVGHVAVEFALGRFAGRAGR